MTGKVASIAIVLTALIAGVAMYYLQVYAFYDDVSEDITEVQLVAFASTTPVPISASNINAIDAESSPIRFRACFETDATLKRLSDVYQTVQTAIPRNAPDWFTCFDAAAIAAELEAGTARAFLGGKNVEFGVDRIVAITEDGRGYIWHELNDCGEKAYDGTIVGEECPRRNTN